MNKKFIVKKVTNGIATVKHKCWFCRCSYTSFYPLDDVGFKTKTKKLCFKCEKDLEKFKKNNPELC